MNYIRSKGIHIGSILSRTVNSNIFIGDSSLTPISITVFQKTLLHSSSVYSQSNESEVQVEGLSPAVTQVKGPPRRLSQAELKKIAYFTVDWLPFKWTMPPQHNPFENPGDVEKYLEYDPTWCKPDYELSEELKTADKEIKLMFSLATANKTQIKEVIKRKWLEKFQRHPNDFDSLEVKIALKTLTVRSLFEHQRDYYKERVYGRKVLDIVIKQRYGLLNRLYKTDAERFNWIIDELKINFKPPKLGGERVFMCKKYDLRRKTKEYCENIIQEKKNAYHEELKKQQADFLKEKEETLAWIAKEEEELARLAVEK